MLSAASWGGSDFAGGWGARRAPALLVVASGQIISLFLLLALCRGMHVPLPATRFLVYAALGGFEGALALALFYRALAMGAMGLTAALTGLLTALIPVVFSIFQEGLPTPLTAAGLAMGLAAIWLITRAPAGVGFGTQLILFKTAGAGGILWAMTATRASGVAALLLVLALMPPKAPWRGFWLIGILAGTLDTFGNLFFLEAARFGRLDVAAVVCSLYPGGTILLAAIVLREWPTRRQLAGIAVALAAVALLSV